MSTASVRPTLFRLALPLFVENAMHVLTSTIDVLMVSTISDDAVAALGIGHQYVVLAIMVFSFVGIGSSVVVTHSIGGEDRKGAQETARTGLVVNLGLGVIISLIVVNTVPFLLGIMQMPPELYQYAEPYLLILGATLWLEAHNVAAGAVLRAYGHPSDAMWVTLAQNILNAIGNAVLLFGLFGAPKMGIVGVALATAGSRVAAAALLAYLLYRRTGVRLHWRDFTRLHTGRLKRIMHIGLPSAGEHLSWWVAFMTVTSFTARMGATELAIQSYTNQIMHFVFSFTFALAMANEILVGRLVGAGEFDGAYRRLITTLKQGLPIIAIAMMPAALFGDWLIGWFTENAFIIATGAILLKIAIIMEPGRLLTMMLVCGLRATGDVAYPLKLGVVGMWGVWVPLSWIFGITLDWGLPGIWAAMIVDEMFRGGLMMHRWVKRRWLPHAERSRSHVEESLADLAG